MSTIDNKNPIQPPLSGNISSSETPKLNNSQTPIIEPSDQNIEALNRVTKLVAQSSQIQNDPIEGSLYDLTRNNGTLTSEDKERMDDFIALCEKSLRLTRDSIEASENA